MEYIPINTFVKHLVLKDVHVLGDFEFFRTFETLNSEYTRASGKTRR